MQYPKIRTASMPLMCIHSGAIMQYPQIRTASLSFSVCSFRSHCAIPSNRDCFPVIQCLFSFRNHCAVPSKQDSFPVFVLIQEPLCSTLKSRQLPCHLTCVYSGTKRTAPKGTETCIFLANVLCSVIGGHLLSGLTRDICRQEDAETAPRLPSQRGEGSV